MYKYFHYNMEASSKKYIHITWQCNVTRISSLTSIILLIYTVGLMVQLIHFPLQWNTIGWINSEHSCERLFINSDGVFQLCVLHSVLTVLSSRDKETIFLCCKKKSSLPQPDCLGCSSKFSNCSELGFGCSTWKDTDSSCFGAIPSCLQPVIYVLIGYQNISDLT